MNFSRVTIAGAGLAGLSAAVRLAEAGIDVAIADAAAQAGGRCRSYPDTQLGRTIDNGNHLVLSGNQAVARFRATIGAPPLAGPDHADFAFCDLRDGTRWTVRINDGRLPWWVLSRDRRIPGTSAAGYAAFVALVKGGAGKRVGDLVKPAGTVWDKFIEPILLAALNTAAAEGAADLTAAMLRETLMKGGRAMRPLIAQPDLASAFTDPALAWLAARGCDIALGRRLRGIGFDGDHVVTLDWADGTEAIAPGMAVLLAVPSWVAATLVPGLVVPDAHRAIINGHFAFAAPAGTAPMLGMLGGTAEWLFAFPDRISVTVSAADRLLDTDRETLARIFWDDIRRATGIEAPMPAWQIVKEKRATFAATPDQVAKRPPAATRWRNLFLAGDWTGTGLPATIEGAIRSGETAAALAIGRSGR